VRFRPLFAALSALLAACGALPTAQPQQQPSLYPSPVAFVTAAPLPQASPTATLQPLPTPTAAPATAVPKPEPQISTAAIGLWSDRLTAASAYTGFLDIAAGLGAPDYRTQRNQRMLALTSLRVDVGFGGTVSDVIQTNPTWVLYDRNNRLVRSADGQPLLNLRDEAIRTQLADQSAQAVIGFDGVILTNVGDDLIRSQNGPVFTGTRAFTDQQRRDAVEGMLRAIRARLQARVLIVAGYAWRDGAAYAGRSNEALDLSAIVDGAHIESFTRAPISKTNEFRGEAGWKRDVDMLAELSKDNRIVLLSTRLDSAEAGDALTLQWLRYSVASYLLGKSGTRTYFQFDAGSPAYAGDPALNAPLGAPTEAYIKTESGIYTRKFERGLVLVNPSSSEKRLSIESGFRTLSGTAVESSVTLGPNTGLILLR
jgi:hypothetical protein